MLRLSYKTAGSGGKTDSAFFPAPTGGMNLISPITNLPKYDAITVSNFVCLTDKLQQRKGVQYHTTNDFSSNPKALHVYAPVNATSKLFATTDAGVYDITTSGAVPAASIALTNGSTIGAVLSTGAQNYLILVNGTDSMVSYDGAAWTATATVGGGAINTNMFKYVEVYRQRVYFIVKDTTRLVYLNANSPTGGGTTYDTAAIFRRGGYLVALGTWTIDGGTGPDDHFVIVTSEGEIAVFTGNDPATWSYKGTYYIASPVGAKPFYKFGGDLLYACNQGVYPLSKALLVATLDRSNAISAKINPLFSALTLTSTLEMAIDPTIPALLVMTISNIYCMNTQTGAWSSWSISQTTCIVTKDTTVYCGFTTGSDKRIIKFVANANDLGQAIPLQITSGKVQFSSRMSTKLEHIQPLYDVPGTSGSSVASGTVTFNGRFNFPVGGSSGVQGAASTVAFNQATNTYFTTAWRTLQDDYSYWKTLDCIISLKPTEALNYYGSNVRFKLGPIYANMGYIGAT